MATCVPTTLAAALNCWRQRRSLRQGRVRFLNVILRRERGPVEGSLRKDQRRGRDRRRPDRISWPPRRSESPLGDPIAATTIERAALGLPVDKVSVGNFFDGHPPAGGGLGDDDDTVWLANREAPDQNRVDGAEDDDVGGNRHRQRGDDRNREQRGVAQPAHPNRRS